MSARHLGLPVVALVAVAAMLGVQLSQGGGTYEPLTPPSACGERPVAPRTDDVDGLTESLVLAGLAETACDLGVGREQLVLDLAAQRTISAAQAEALRAGLLAAVERLQADGSLPPASALQDEVLADADLNPLLSGAIGLLPDGVVDTALPTDEVLSRAVESLDLQVLLADLDDQAGIEDAVEDAVTQAVRDTLVARIRGLLP